MGQVVVPGTPPSIILTAVDRLVSSNAGGGISPLASHIILLGEDAGENLGDVDDIVGIGRQTVGGDGGSGFADSRLNGTVVIGHDSLTGPVNGGSVDPGGAITILGSYTASEMLFGGASVFLGDRILTSALGAAGKSAVSMVVIGSRAAENLYLDNVGGNSNLSTMTAIGYHAVTQGAAGDINHQASYTGLTAIGAEVLRNLASSLTSHAYNGVWIGAGAGSDAGAAGPCTSNVVIGQGSAQFCTIKGCVVLGHSAMSLTQNDDIIAIGNGTGVTAPTGGGSIIIGSMINCIGTAGVNSNNVFLGNAANAANTVYTNRFLLDHMGNTLAFADFVNGNWIFGRSVEGTDRDSSGTNTVKLLNGTAGAAAPLAGGRFYASGGELHWVSSANTDYLLTPSASRGTFAVAALPAVGLVAGQRAYVNNALAPAFGAAVAGGGAVFVPVFYNGAAWIVG